MQGATVYRENCASCHGVKGDGKGIIELDRPARAFSEGGFAFGNTRDQLFKTITDGMPNNKSDMQAYKELLSEDDRWAVVDHVLAKFVPKEAPLPPGARQLDVLRRALIVRGHLAAITKGADRIPRGLLIGLPGDLAFEYDAKNVRLLGVRDGRRFVDRTDWGGRGGTEMKPLGKIIQIISGGRPQPFSISSGAAARPVEAQLVSTFVEGPVGGLAYRLRLSPDEGAVNIEERLETRIVNRYRGYRRRMTVRSDRPQTLQLELDGTAGEILHGGADTGTPGFSYSDRHMMVRRTSGGRLTIWRLPALRPVRGNDSSLALEVEVDGERATEFEVAAWIVNEWNEDLLDLLKRSR